MSDSNTTGDDPGMSHEDQPAMTHESEPGHDP